MTGTDIAQKLSSETVLTAAVEHGLFADNERDPFKSHTMPLFANPRRAVKTVLMIPLVLVRFVFALLCIALGVSFSYAALCCPQHGYMRALALRLMLACTRGLLWWLGFHWVAWSGKPASKSTAPIVVSNHVSFMETFYLTYVLHACGMTETSTRSSAAGSATRALDYVFVDRADPESRTAAQNAMQAKVSDSRARQFMMCPEGQTSNGSQIISFKEGAFRLGVPVQPVAVKYGCKNCFFASDWDPTSVDNMPAHFIRALFEWHHHVHMTWLPPHTPTDAETQSPQLFAANVRSEIAAQLGVPTTEHGHDDVRLARFARREFSLKGAPFVMPEMHLIRTQLGLTIDDVKEYLRQFMVLDAESCPPQSCEDYLRALSLPDHPDTRRLFTLRESCRKDQKIGFREFLVGRAVQRGIPCRGEHEDIRKPPNVELEVDVRGEEQNKSRNALGAQPVVGASETAFVLPGAASE